MNADRKHPEQDPAEGSREVIDHELRRQDGEERKEGKDDKPAGGSGKAADESAAQGVRD